LVVLLVRANTITKKEKKSSWTGDSIRLTFHLYIYIYIHTHHLLLHARMIPFIFNSNRPMNKIERALVRSSKRFAPLHHLTCFLLLLLVIIQALYGTLVRFLHYYQLLLSILTLFRFCYSSSLHLCYWWTTE
jgi:hypothetical protein